MLEGDKPVSSAISLTTFCRGNNIRLRFSSLTSKAVLTRGSVPMMADASRLTTDPLRTNIFFRGSRANRDRSDRSRT